MRYYLIWSIDGDTGAVRRILNRGEKVTAASLKREHESRRDHSPAEVARAFAKIRKS